MRRWHLWTLEGETVVARTTSATPASHGEPEPRFGSPRRIACPSFRAPTLDTGTEASDDVALPKEHSLAMNAFRVGGLVMAVSLLGGCPGSGIGAVDEITMGDEDVASTDSPRDGCLAETTALCNEARPPKWVAETPSCRAMWTTQTICTIWNMSSGASWHVVPGSE